MTKCNKWRECSAEWAEEECAKMVHTKAQYNRLFKDIQDQTIIHLTDKGKLFRLSKTLRKAMKQYKSDFGEEADTLKERMKLRSLTLLTRKRPYKYSVTKGVVYIE